MESLVQANTLAQPVCARYGSTAVCGVSSITNSVKPSHLVRGKKYTFPVELASSVLWCKFTTADEVCYFNQII